MTKAEVVRRKTARVLPIDCNGRILLMHGWDPAKPESPFWFTIGGGAEPGEDLPTAAARELLEETGIVIEPAALGKPVAHHQHQFGWDGMVLVQDETYYAVRVGDVTVNFEGMEQIELDTTDSADWWTPDDLDADGGAGFEQLTDVMRTAIARAS